MQLGKGKEEDYIKCPKCGKMIEKSRVIKKKYVCYECGGYFRVRTNNRIRMVADLNTFEPWFEDMPVSNPLSYEGYEEKLEEDDRDRRRPGSPGSVCRVHHRLCGELGGGQGAGAGDHGSRKCRGHRTGDRPGGWSL